MDRNAIASEVTELGARENRITRHVRQKMRELSAIQKRRCELLTHVACHPDAGLDTPTVAAASAPKDEN